MDNYSIFSNFTTTAPPFYQCPQLAEFAQWRNTYLSPAVFRNSIASVAVNGLLLLITAPSNALVMFCILIQRRFRRSSFMIMLLSLSTTDFLVGSLVQPLFIACRVSELLGHTDLVCRVRLIQTVAGVTCLGASLAHTCLISIERYLAVRFPARHKLLFTNHRALMSVSFIWLFFTAYSVLPVVGYPEVGKLAGRSVMIALIIIVTAGCYIGTFVELGASNMRLNTNQASSVAPADVVPGQVSAAALRRKKKEKKLARTMLITVGIMAFCYLPEMVAYPMLPRNREEMGINWIVLSWTNTLIYCNSCVNPFWYCWRMPHLRMVARKLLGLRERRMYKENVEPENLEPENAVPNRVRIIGGRAPNFAGGLYFRPAYVLSRRGEMADLPINRIVTSFSAIRFPSRRASVPNRRAHETSTIKKQRSYSNGGFSGPSPDRVQ